MKVNEPLNSPKTSNPQTYEIVSNGSSPPSEVPSSGVKNPTEPVLPPQRQMAWRVASNLAVSFKYAWAGLSYTFQTQRNFRIHVFIGALAIGLSVFLHLKSVEVAIIGLTCGLVLVMELLNTAIESVVDLTVKQTYHDLAKIAKDCAAGAVLISAMASVLVASLLILPPLFSLIYLSVIH
ncbi:MAG TPA: diacylglycerol kinase [Cyanobacteria bacterium UBA11369]|nr:diacylglycerol kinase [Cyanobacteria bacterium UBA11371]HBE36315.1 diacylglycerol kinase [Cyanobacteria bacterium UBA11368]HBE51429.1 diacylglycerol kinase [Cyanobacteria bacterium UBA11369]